MAERITIKKKLALVTGGSSGIGFQICRQLLARQFRVILVARNIEKLEKAQVELKSEFPHCDVKVMSCDITSPQGARSLADVIGESGDCVDYLFNNAGIIHTGTFESLSIEEHEDALRTNYLSSVTMTKAFLPQLRKSKDARVVFTGSVASFLGVYGHSSYAPSKFAMLGLAECLRHEFGELGIKVCIAFPPDTETPMLAHERAHAPAKSRAMSAAIKPLGSEQVAKKIVHGATAGRFEIFIEQESRFIRILKSILPWFYYRQIDRMISGS